MHELGIADAMVKTIRRILADESDARLASVTVELGDLSGVVPRFLQSAWTAVIENTDYEGAVLHIHPVPATARCEDCGEFFVVNAEDLRCPRCRGDKLTPLSGQDFTLAEIEVGEEEA